MPKKQKASKMETILQTAAQMADVPPSEETPDEFPKQEQLSIALGNDKYVTLKEWKGTKRVDIRRWINGVTPTKEGASLHLDEWKIICNHAEIIDEFLERSPCSDVDWRYHLGRDFSLSIRSPHPYVHITKFCYPEDIRRFPVTTIGLSLRRDEWEALKKAMPTIEQEEPELRHLIPLYRTDL